MKELAVHLSFLELGYEVFRPKHVPYYDGGSYLILFGSQMARVPYQERG